MTGFRQAVFEDGWPQGNRECPLWIAVRLVPILDR